MRKIDYGKKKMKIKAKYCPKCNYTKMVRIKTGEIEIWTIPLNESHLTGDFPSTRPLKNVIQPMGLGIFKCENCKF